MTGIESDVSEIHALGVHLAQLGVAVGGVVAAAVTETGAGIETDIKAGVPVLTGGLRDGMSVTVTSDGEFTQTIIEVRSAEDYWRFVEYGTSDDAPQPFVRSAVERHEPEIPQVFDKIGRLI